MTNRVRACRIVKGWSQDELAAKAGISRAGVSGIETNRLVPSTSAALALAAAFGCHVEDLFRLASSPGDEVAWAWQPRRNPGDAPCRYWRASVADRDLLYPTEPTNLGTVGHDGVYCEGRFQERPCAAPSDTLVIASCDPAVGILADELKRYGNIRLLAFQRSSHEALDLLSRGLVHVAGIHLTTEVTPGRNAAAAKSRLSGSLHLLHGARWEEGLAFAPGLALRSVHAALTSRARWVGRESGSAVRQLLDELLGDRRPPRRIAQGHHGVAEAIRCGWADVGVCLRLVSEEAGLGYISLRHEEYDFCYPANLEGDPRIQALILAVRSISYRTLLGGLPGYDATGAGELEQIG